MTNPYPHSQPPVGHTSAPLADRRKLPTTHYPSSGITSFPLPGVLGRGLTTFRAPRPAPAFHLVSADRRSLITLRPTMANKKGDSGGRCPPRIALVIPLCVQSPMIRACQFGPLFVPPQRGLSFASFPNPSRVLFRDPLFTCADEPAFTRRSRVCGESGPRCRPTPAAPASPARAWARAGSAHSTTQNPSPWPGPTVDHRDW